ncbi:hemocytin-like [Saccostrea echinata]|uniref:hemocytin-like n=1 Tax=Saccostrea echinata TaxID=191078 RepID=UPI002A822029|nr:hemocytin-like [Saccostrea echinata]
MGMESKEIRNEMITASSFRDANSSPEKTCLNTNGFWMPATDTKSEYLQIDFLQQAYLTGVTTQGRPDATTYVTSYKVQFSTDGNNWNTYREAGAENIATLLTSLTKNYELYFILKIFSANIDSSTPVTYYFTSPLHARFLRILPQTWQGKIALRVEVFGCPVTYPTTTPLPTPKPTTALTQALKPRVTFTINSVPDRRGHVAYDQRGHIVSCNLWEGLTCNNMDQFDPTGCLDYRVRLGCLKQTSECVPMPNTNLYKTVAPVLNPHVVSCFEGLDTSQCPNCSAGLYCDGMRCVKKADCTCQYNNKIIMKSDIVTTDMCETCQCYSGELRCVPKSCPPCSAGETKVVNMTSCSCSCKTCDADINKVMKTVLTIPQSFPLSQHQPLSPVTCDSVHCQALVKPPMMPGEVARIVKTSDGCCDKSELVCKPETCSIHPLTCTPPQLMKNINPGECCPTFQRGMYLKFNWDL